MNEMKNFAQAEAGEDNESEFDSTSSEEEETVLEINPVTQNPTTSQLVDITDHNNYSQLMKHGLDNYGSSEHSVDDLAAPTVYLSPVNVQTYFLNVGVSILPGKSLYKLCLGGFET